MAGPPLNTMSKSKAKPAATAPAEPASDSRPLQSVGDALTDHLTSHLKAELGIPDPPQEQPKVDEGGPDPGTSPESPAAQSAAPGPDPEQEPAPESDPEEAAPEGAAPDEPAETTTDVSALYQTAADDSAANEESSADDAEGDDDQRVPLKRLHKEVSRRKALEARISELEARTAPTPAPPSTAPFIERLPEVAAARVAETELASAIANAKALARVAQADPDAARQQLKAKHGFDAQAIGDVELAQQLEDTLDTLRQQHTEAVTKRVATTERARMQLDGYRQQQDAAAARQYPWMADRKSAEFAAGQQLVREFPGLKDHPLRGFIIGRQVAGLMAERAAAHPPPDPAPKRQHPPKIPAPRTVPRSTSAPSRPADALAAAKAAAVSGDGTAMAEALTGIV